MGKKSRGNGEGTIYKREIHGKQNGVQNTHSSIVIGMEKERKKQSLEILDKKLRKN